MKRIFPVLMKKDFKLMVSGKFFLLALGSLILYSCYINFIYVNLEQEIYPVCLYDPYGKESQVDSDVIKVESREKMKEMCADGYTVGLDASGRNREIYMVSSGNERVDSYRAAYAVFMISAKEEGHAKRIGRDDKEMKNRREITAEFLFFELAAVGFLGLASLLFKEKQMGVIRVHGVMPVRKSMYIFSKLAVILLSDMLFSVLLVFMNLGICEGVLVLPEILLQAAILSLIMALAGFLFAARLSDFKQFSLFYLVLAVFVTTPVFLAGQVGISMKWIVWHPMYHLFMAMKRAFFGTAAEGGLYYLLCAGTIVCLFLAVNRALACEMIKEG